ncbi:MAG TPA: hypothetical protein VEW42_02590 [Candidatus Eisenbacteria bacterium]|nr:hypothetical protein [Candidatus Eisenbacteria bacterium]
MSQKVQKILAFILLLVLVIAIPLTVWFGKQQQQTQQKASTQVWNGGTACGVHVAFENESPSCPGGSKVATDTYTTTVRLTSADGSTHAVNYLFESFWCKDTSELGDGVNPTSCIKRVKNNNQTISVGPGAGVTVTSAVQTASSYGFGTACGVYQTDFSFTVGSCHFGYSALDPSPAHPVLAAGYCNTGQTCSPPTATPTTPVTPPTATPTAPVTPPTATPTTPVTPTMTPAPSTTPTPTSPPTVTPTNPPGPTNTPVPPKPTLPPTGPGDTILGVGLAGVAAVVIGTLVILAL